MEFTYTIPILGTISAGKSTLLNGLFAKNYSQMNIRRTTMCPQFYNLPYGEEFIIKDNYKKIVEYNSELNKKFQNNIWDGKTVKSYNVAFPPDFIKTHPDIHFRIADIPGINDQQTRDIYMSWIEKEFKKFDLAILVVDIHSGFNTSDEISVLNLIFKKMQEHPHVNLIILINKCDDMIFKDGIFQTDEEKDQIYHEQVVPTIKKAIEEWHITDERVHIQKFCSRNIFIYRTISYNEPEKIQTFLGDKHLHDMMVTEIGRNSWFKMTDELKEIRIKEMLKKLQTDKECYENNMVHCGFKMFCEKMNNFIYGKKSIELYLDKTMALFLEQDNNLEQLIDFSEEIATMHFDNDFKEHLITTVKNYVKGVIIPEIICKNNDLQDVIKQIMKYENTINEINFMSNKDYICNPLIEKFWINTKNKLNRITKETFIDIINFSTELANRYKLTIPAELIRLFLLNNVIFLYGDKDFFKWLNTIISNYGEYVKMFIYTFLKSTYSPDSVFSLKTEQKIISLYYFIEIFKNHFKYQIYCKELLRQYSINFSGVYLTSKYIEENEINTDFMEWLINH